MNAHERKDGPERRPRARTADQGEPARGAQRPGGAGVGNRALARMLEAAPQRPQAQGERETLAARLQVVRQRLAQLRAAHDQRSGAYAQATMKERLAQSLAQGTQDLRRQARADSAASQVWGGTRAVQSIQSAVGVAQSGKEVTLNVNLQIAYDGLDDAAARKRAATDIPRIASTIRDAWQVDITQGEYAGVRFRMQPRVTWLGRKRPRASNAFLIQVRKPDTGPSSGDSVGGVISLAPVHLEGARVIVVAHELAHLFGFVDTYLQMLLHERIGKRPKDREQWGVGRGDAAGRADLLGLVDPVVLQRLRKKHAITEQEFKRESQPVKVWEQEASVVLRTLGVAPLPPDRPVPASADFDPAVELERIRREGEGKLARLRAEQQRLDDTVQSLQDAEAAIALEGEEKDLLARLAALPATP